jgi:hypothetical protein
MEQSNLHCTEPELAQYARRNLPWRAVLKIDRHLQRCGRCALRLAGLSNVRRAKALLRSVTSDDPHLSYEQIEALAESRVELTGPLQAHVAGCHTCHAELAEMQAFVASFGVPPVRREASWSASVGRWFERPLQLGGVVAAVAVICVGMSVVEKHATQTGSSNLNAAHTVVADSGQSNAAFEDCSVTALRSTSAQWIELYRRGEFQQLAQALRGPANEGNTVAQTTLAILLAKGLGTEQNLGAAQAWLRRAAERGDSCARQVLSTLE